jgi:hypothetical protein
MTDLVPKAKPEDIANGKARYTGAESLVHRKVSVKGSGGVSTTVVITVQQGQVLDIDSAAIHVGSNHGALES